MKIKSALATSVVAISLLSAASAQAGGPAPFAAEPAPAVAPAATPKPTLTFGFDISPEFYASSKVGSYNTGDLASTVAKLSISKALSGGYTIGGALAMTAREPGTGGTSSTYTQLEVSASYKFKVGKAWSFSPSATLGYAFGDEPKVNPTDSKSAEAYYALGLNVDYKIAPKLTWNVASLRYRDAFRGDWKTPKISTGVTYALDDTNVAYANIGKSWKDSGSGYKNDKFSIAFGLKHSF